MKAQVHPTAIVDPKARLGRGVRIGAFALVGPEVTLGDETEVHPRASLVGCTTLGPGCRIFPCAMLGLPPQDLKFKGERTTLELGEQTVVREFCTLHPGTALGGGRTVIGAHCLIMAYAHVAHDCRLEDHVIVGNATQLAGHVVIGEGARVSAMSAVHQFIRIGRGAFVTGMSGVGSDVPPFTLADGRPARIRGLNLEGLKRRGLPEESVETLKKAFRLLYDEELSRSKAYEEVARRRLDGDPLVREFVEFIKMTDSGCFGRALEAERAAVPPGERDGTLGFKLDVSGAEENGA
jgi:UDP-N-acetylglucosamine acyltransferase